MTGNLACSLAVLLHSQTLSPLEHNLPHFTKHSESRPHSLSSAEILRPPDLKLFQKASSDGYASSNHAQRKLDHPFHSWSRAAFHIKFTGGSIWQQTHSATLLSRIDSPPIAAQRVLTKIGLKLEPSNSH